MRFAGLLREHLKTINLLFLLLTNNSRTVIRSDTVNSMRKTFDGLIFRYSRLTLSVPCCVLVHLSLHDLFFFVACSRRLRQSTYRTSAHAFVEESRSRRTVTSAPPNPRFSVGV